ncbi:hypothetical protein H6F89_21235 [Cyanobacteria bacterium FACHB-63]|nr:hypothetical protein [Cyanobacteria bacterium FACHB-63]
MPQSSFVPKLHQLGISLKTGRSLATVYQTSLLATLVRMLQYGVGDHALVLWHCVLKPSEMKQSPPIKAQRKLRVCWKIQTQDWTGGFIPKDKSIPHDSLISQAYVSGQSYSGAETINLGWTSIRCNIEAMPIRLGDRISVLSLLHPTDG